MVYSFKRCYILEYLNNNQFNNPKYEKYKLFKHSKTYRYLMSQKW